MSTNVCHLIGHRWQTEQRKDSAYSWFGEPVSSLGLFTIMGEGPYTGAWVMNPEKPNPWNAWSTGSSTTESLSLSQSFFFYCLYNLRMGLSLRSFMSFLDHRLSLLPAGGTVSIQRPLLHSTYTLEVCGSVLILARWCLEWGHYAHCQGLHYHELITSQRFYSLPPSLWELGLQHEVSVGRQAFHLSVICHTHVWITRRMLQLCLYSIPCHMIPFYFR